MFRSVRVLTSTFFHQNQVKKCPSLIGFTFCPIPQCRNVSYMSQRRLGLQPTLMLWLSYLRSRYCMWKLRHLLGSDFNEFDFMTGVRQAAVIILDAVRRADWSLIHSCCTDQGACSIYGQTQSQRNLQCTQLVRFKTEHLCQAVPVSVQRLVNQGRSYVYATIVFVGLRDMRDFATAMEKNEMSRQIKEVLQESRIPESYVPNHRRFVLSEFLLTLRKELTGTDADIAGWLIESYKIIGIKLVNYSPVTLQYRIIEFLKTA